MPYPTDAPTRKHDLVGPWPLPSANDGDGGILSPSYHANLSSTAAIFQELEHTGEKDGPKPNKVSAVYTYKDAPEDPAPPSRALVIVGFADTSLSLVRKLTSSDSLPSNIHKCTVGVKRADSKYRQQLDPKNVQNSDAFAKLMASLREEGAVAIVARDKYDRFGILCPMEQEEYGGDNGQYSAVDYAGNCFFGNVGEVKNMLMRRAAPASVPPVEDKPAEEPNADLWQPPGGADEPQGDTFGGAGDSGSGLWQPPGDGDDQTGSGDGFGSWDAPASSSWDAPTSSSFAMNGANAGQKRRRSEGGEDGDDGEKFHADTGAAAADAFYSGLTRTLDTRADSRLYHMRAFNGWVKATQIAELDPKTRRGGKRSSKGAPLRVLDLACGKGGDLGKWTLHTRGVENYVGIDVARGSLRDAAVRARRMREKLKQCTFTCADLGADVPGRLRSSKHKRMQKLLSWSLGGEAPYESGDPNFEMVEGGGVSPHDKFDVVSIQFAIHYMMSTKKRARRFFKTVSDLLDVGGNLIATTIDARVVLDHMMDLGLDLHFNEKENDEEGGGNSGSQEEGATVKVGGGACLLKFDGSVVRRIFELGKGKGDDLDESLFGLQYTFTLVEGSDHSAGVGEAVDLPEWLTPIPVLKSLASEAGLELEYATNFHEFYASRKDPLVHPMAHNALYNMKVLNRNGSISSTEWEISRMYVAVKFRKVRESRLVLEEDDEIEEEEEPEEKAAAATAETTIEDETALASPKAKKMFPVAMMKAKKTAGEDTWKTLSNEEKNRLTKVELLKML